MKAVLLSSICLAFVLPAFAGKDVPMEQVPENWRAMEIEAKWEAEEDQLKRLLKDMREGKHEDKMFEDYDLKIKAKNDGVPTLMMDNYYDDSRSTLANSNTVLRLRRIFNVSEDMQKYKKLGEKAELEKF